MATGRAPDAAALTLPAVRLTTASSCLTKRGARAKTTVCIHSHCVITMSRLRTDIKTLFQDFPGLAKATFQGFPGLKTFFLGHSWIHSIDKHGLREVKTVHIPNQSSVYLHYSKQAQMQYLWLY